MTPAEATLERLTPKLKSIAYRVAQGDPSGVIDADDIFQEMAIVLLDRAERNPDFINQKDSYILIVCRHNGGSHKTRTERTRFLGRFHPIVENDEDPIEMLPSPEPTPEKQVIDAEHIQAISAAILSLTPANQQVVKMLYFGDSQKEIAAVLGVSPAAVTQRKRTIARIFSEYIPA